MIGACGPPDRDLAEGQFFNLKREAPLVGQLLVIASATNKPMKRNHRDARIRATRRRPNRPSRHE